MKRFLAAAATLSLLALMPAATSGALAQLSALAGKPATDLTFSPVGASPLPLIAPGKPTVVIAFASWCFACMDEMPRNLADYAKYKDRVNFLGIDYLDGDQQSSALIAKYAIPFPVERDGTAATPAPGATHAPAAVHLIQLPGVAPKDLPSIAVQLKAALPPQMYAPVADIVAHCASLSDDACIAYAKAHGVTIGGPMPTPTPSGDTDVALPTTFVLDANGVVVDKLQGYNTTRDDLATALDKLLKPATKP